MISAVLGCGRWGTFIAWYLDKIGHSVTLYGRSSSENMRRLMADRENEYLKLTDTIELTCSLDCVDRAEIVVISVGAQNLRQLCTQLKESDVRDKIFVLCMKGIEIETGERLSSVVRECVDPSNKIAVWLGPGHVQEFYRGVPNCMVIDSNDETAKQLLVNEFSSELIRFYYGQDLIGNEIGGAAKNVIGIAAGMLDGKGLSTLKGALMSRGTREIARLIQAMGGNELSAYGLCHLGDYQATLFSPYSHNRRFGEAFVKGEPYNELAEGYYTVKALLKLGNEHQVDLPICAAVHEMLYEDGDPEQVLKGLFTRSLKNEF